MVVKLLRLKFIDHLETKCPILCYSQEYNVKEIIIELFVENIWIAQPNQISD